MIRTSRDGQAMHRPAPTFRRKLFGDEHVEVAASLGQIGWVLHE
jgi:hypothetical protein